MIFNNKALSLEEQHCSTVLLPKAEGTKAQIILEVRGFRGILELSKEKTFQPFLQEDCNILDNEKDSQEEHYPAWETL